MSPFLISIIVFLMAYALIASEKIEKAIAAVFGAAAMVLLGAADFEFMLGKIDLNVLVFWQKYMLLSFLLHLKL